MGFLIRAAVHKETGRLAAVPPDHSVKLVDRRFAALFTGTEAPGCCTGAPQKIKLLAKTLVERRPVKQYSMLCVKYCLGLAVNSCLYKVKLLLLQLYNSKPLFGFSAAF